MECELNINIQMFDQSRSVKVHQSDSLQTLKLLIFSQYKTALINYNFCLNGYPVDSLLTLEQLNIKEGDTLEIEEKTYNPQPIQLTSSLSLASTVVDLDDEDLLDQDIGNFDDQNTQIDEEEDFSMDISFFSERNLQHQDDQDAIRMDLPDLAANFSFAPILRRQFFHNSC